MVDTLIHSMTPRLTQPSLTRAARLAILAAIVTMALKFVAYAVGKQGQTLTALRMELGRIERLDERSAARRSNPGDPCDYQ